MQSRQMAMEKIRQARASKPLPFSLPLLKTVTSFKFTPKPLLMVTASLVSVLKPRRIEPFEWALKHKRDRGHKKTRKNACDNKQLQT